MSNFVILVSVLPVILLILAAGCIMIISVVRARKGDLVALAKVFADCLVRLGEQTTRVQHQVRKQEQSELNFAADEAPPSAAEDA